MPGFPAILGMLAISHETAKARSPNRDPGTFTPLRNEPGIPGMQTAIVSLVTDAEYSNPVSPSPAGRLLRAKSGSDRLPRLRLPLPKIG